MKNKLENIPGTQEEKWDLAFERKGELYSQLSEEQIKKITEKLEDNIRVLEIGCGNGVLLDQLEKSGKNFKLTGADISGKALEASRKKVPEADFLKLDVTKDDITGTYDVIIMKFSIGCLKSEEFSSQEELWDKVLQKISQNCQQLILITPVPKDINNPRSIYVPKDIFERLTNKYFGKVELIEKISGKGSFDQETYLLSEPKNE